MATKRTSEPQGKLIRCSRCGEDYSRTYKHCPFCDEFEKESEHSAGKSSKGGKRLASGSKQSVSLGKVIHIISIVISLLVILAAAWVVFTVIIPMVDRGSVGTIDPSGPSTSPVVNSPAVSDSGAADPVSSPPSVSSSGTGTSDADTSDPGTFVEPDPSPSPTAEQTAQSFSLSSSDVTLEQQGQTWSPGVTFSPEGTTAQLTWESDNPAVASVSADGVVTAVALGTCTISAMLPGGETHACIVRCSWEDTSGGDQDEAPSSGYTVNNPDFTFYQDGETYRLKVNGYSGGVSWSSDDTSVATVSSDGTCTAVADGNCTVTGILDDGSKVEAIVRVRLS